MWLKLLLRLWDPAATGVGTRGVLRLDDFESRRFSYIGTLEEPDPEESVVRGKPGWIAREYEYGSVRPHAATAVGVQGEAAAVYEYDYNGNPSTGFRQVQPTSSGQA